jgi:protease-4
MDQTLMERVLLASIEEQRRARRWRNFWRAVWAAIVISVIWAVFISSGPSTGVHPTSRHTALVNLSGVIDAESNANAESITISLREAFGNQSAAGVILRINSPGGSPVQAGIVYDEILRLKAQYPDKKLMVVVEEVAASGGYYIAAAADAIYVDKASLVGSIGVRMDGFGFTEAMKKLGIERRVLTAGDDKALLDPFLAVDPKQKAAVQQMLTEVHQQFIAAVKKGRGDRLKAVPEIFSGMVWTGTKSVELGLADGLGTVDTVARDVLKADEVIDYSLEPNLAERIAHRFGASIGDAAARVLLHWSIR